MARPASGPSAAVAHALQTAEVRPALTLSAVVMSGQADSSQPMSTMKLDTSTKLSCGPNTSCDSRAPKQPALEAAGRPLQQQQQQQAVLRNFICSGSSI
jgi:hypothetical protein